MVLFYIVAGALALASALLLVRPLLAGRAGGAVRAESDARIYRDQLDEIDRYQALGTIDAEQAEAARAEVSRRLLAAADRAHTAAPPAPAPRRLSVAVAAGALIGAPALAALIYAVNGAPGLPDLPLAERAEIAAADSRFALRPSQAQAEAAQPAKPAEPMPDEVKEYAALITRLETVLEERPNDVRGLATLANGYARLGRHAEAWRTFKRLIDALGDQAGAETYAEMAEMMVLAADGYVSPEAEQAIGAALVRNPQLSIARFYHGLLMAQSGNLDAAIATWERLRAEATTGAPWLGFLEQMLAAERAERGSVAGPSAAEAEAASALTPEERQAMIEGMVARLEARLTSEGGPPEDWLRLINAYVQLDRSDDAARVARLGIASFDGSGEAGFLREQALLMGVIEE